MDAYLVITNLPDRDSAAKLAHACDIGAARGEIGHAFREHAAMLGNGRR